MADNMEAKEEKSQSKKKQCKGRDEILEQYKREAQTRKETKRKRILEKRIEERKVNVKFLAKRLKYLNSFSCITFYSFSFR